MSYRRWILVAVALFVIGAALGLFIPGGNASPQAMAALRELGELSNLLFSLPTPLMIMFVFGKNALSLALSFIFSPLLCLLPALALVANGGLLTLVSASVVPEKSLGFVLAGILPHGVLEIPALIMGEAAALSFGAAAMLALVKKERRSQLVPALKQNLRYLLIAIILLVPAAIIEVLVTPLLMGRL
jgi:stage II sporulation protein M